MSHLLTATPGIAYLTGLPASCWLRSNHNSSPDPAGDPSFNGHDCAPGCGLPMTSYMRHSGKIHSLRPQAMQAAQSRTDTTCSHPIALAILQIAYVQV